MTTAEEAIVTINAQLITITNKIEQYEKEAIARTQILNNITKIVIGNGEPGLVGKVCILQDDVRELKKSSSKVVTWVLQIIAAIIASSVTSLSLFKHN